MHIAYHMSGFGFFNCTMGKLDVCGCIYWIVWMTAWFQKPCLNRAACWCLGTLKWFFCFPRVGETLTLLCWMTLQGRNTFALLARWPYTFFAQRSSKVVSKGWCLFHVLLDVSFCTLPGPELELPSPLKFASRLCTPLEESKLCFQRPVSGGEGGVESGIWFIEVLSGYHQTTLTSSYVNVLHLLYSIIQCYFSHIRDGI